MERLICDALMFSTIIRHKVMEEYPEYLLGRILHSTFTTTIDPDSKI